jgi:hypothetical protein
MFYEIKQSKIKEKLPKKVIELIQELSSFIGSFSWVTERNNSGWSAELTNSKQLKFECNKNDLATKELGRICQLYLELLNIESS